MNNIQFFSEPSTPANTNNKPIELYIFIDPLCQTALQIQSILKRLQIEYDHYFSWRFILSTKLASLNCLHRKTKGCFTGVEVDITHPALPSIAIKAAEMQGKKSAARYMLKLQEHALLETKDITSYNALVEIAEQSNLDVDEFKKDFCSKETARAFQSDLYIAREMEVDELPSIVFFNECIEDEGLKISGTYSYEVYVQILKEILDEEIISKPLPTYDELFERFQTFTTKEVSEIYRISEKEAERELKKRMLQQKVERLSKDDITLWRIK